MKLARIRLAIAGARAGRTEALRAGKLVKHAEPHYTPGGGCLCVCRYCVRLVLISPESDPAGPILVRRRCICHGCTQDCPADRLDLPDDVPDSVVDASDTIFIRLFADGNEEAVHALRIPSTAPLMFDLVHRDARNPLVAAHLIMTIGRKP